MHDLCAAGNISERSLHRMFVRHLGESMTDYLGRLRIGRACRWLAETDRPISVIAPDCGFTNLSNFNRRFRAERNMSPKEFRLHYRRHGSVDRRDFSLVKSAEEQMTRRAPEHRRLIHLRPGSTESSKSLSVAT